MAIPLKVDVVNGITRQFATADTLDVDSILRRAATGNMTIGSNLGVTEELQLGSATSAVRVMGDLLVNGSETILTNDTITGTFTANGNVNLGDGTGDIINLGGGISDSVNLKASLKLGAGLVGIGSGVTDYASGMWLQAASAAGPAAAYDLRASGANAGAYAIGVNSAALTNATGTDLQTVLAQFDTAISGGGSPDGTDLTAFTINRDAVAATLENASLVLKGGNGATKVYSTELVQNSSTGASHIQALDTGAQVSTTFGIGDPAATVAGLSSTLQLSATNSATTPAASSASLSYAVAGTATSGSVKLTGTNVSAFELDTMPLQLNERVADPAAVLNAGQLYTKDVSTVSELFYTDSAGNVIQITSGGQLNASLTLQQAYAAGNTIVVDAANGPLTLSDDTDATTTLSISRSPVAATAGDGIAIALGANVSGSGISVSHAGSGSAGLFNSTGSGDALTVQDGGIDVLRVDALGGFSVVTTSGSAASISATGAALTLAGGAASSLKTSAGNLTLESTAAELVLNDVGASALTLSQVGDRILDRTATGEVLNGATSVIGALNRLARRLEVGGELTAEFPIENGVTIAAGDVVAASAVAGRVTLNNDNAETRTAVIGIAITGGTGDAAGTVKCRFYLPGSVATVPGAAFTAGSPVFAPDGTGAPTTTAPANIGDRVTRIGYAISATQFVFQPTEGFAL